MRRFKTLGTLSLSDDEESPEALNALTQPKRTALLLYLALARPGEWQRRDLLLGLLWPDLDEARARNALSQALHHLRRSLGAESLPGQGAELVRLEEGRVRCDAADFLALIEQRRSDEALALYQGELAPGFHLTDAPEFERWLDGERERLRTLAFEAARTSATEAESRGDLRAAGEALRRALQLRMEDEETLRRLLVMLDRAGDRASAIRAYEESARWLREELEVDPSPETVALVGAIRNRRQAAPPAVTPVASPILERAAPAPVLDASPAPAPPRESRVPVGIVALLALVLLAGIAIVARGRSEGNSTTRIVAILPFRTMGDPALGYVGEGITSLLQGKLDRAGGVRIADPRALRALTENIGERPDADRAAVEAARRLGATFIVIGEVTSIGAQVQVRADVRRSDSPQQVVATGTVTGARDSLFTLADSLAIRLLAEGIGVGRRNLLAAAMLGTSSLPAFRAFLDGEAAMRGGRYAEAADRYRTAIGLDSSFAVAAYRGAVALDWAGFISPDAIAMLERAKRGEVRLTERERHLLAGATAYYSQHGDRAESELRAVLADDPDAIEAWYLLGETQFHLGPPRGHRWRESRAAFEHVVAYDRDDPEAILHLARIAAADRDLPRLDSLLDIALPSLGNSVRAWELRALRAYLSRDPREIAALHAGLRTAPPGSAGEAARGAAVFLQDLDAANALITLGPHGREGPRTVEFAAAAGRWSEVFTLLQANLVRDPSLAFTRLWLASLPGVPVTAGEAEAWTRALEDYHSGDPSQRLTLQQETLQAFVLGRFAAVQGDSARWQSERRWLRRTDDSVAGRLPFLHAAARIVEAEGTGSPAARSSIADSLAHWAREASLDGTARFGDVAFPARLITADLFFAVGRDSLALQLYESFPDASGRDLHFLPYARLGEARIHARRGERALARAHYETVLRFWKDSDPGFKPFVESARREYAALQ
jgi:DNA-binding SARP family transcriptional activator/TolB-like protein